MHTQIESGFDRAEAVHPIQEPRHERARVVASLAEYLAEDVQEHPDHAREAIASLAEWCEGDRVLLAEARMDVLRDTPTVQASAGEAHRGAAKLLEILAKRS